MEHISSALLDYKSSETLGDYKTEEDAKAVVRSFLLDSPDFTLLEEVDCWYYGSAAFCESSRGRIDFVLLPKRGAIEKGWVNGAVGIECKKSGHKVGPLICQMLDYRRSMIKVPTSGIVVAISAVFSFPWFEAKGSTESFCTNNCIGTCSVCKSGFKGQIGGRGIFTVSSERLLSQCNVIVSGHKNGSR